MDIQQTYEVVDLDDDVDVLKPHPQNPNRGDDDLVEESVDTNGWYGAIIAQKSTGYVLAGHTRYRVAQRKKAKQVPVIWKDVDDETALRILLADNETARAATMDEDLIGQILDQLGDLRGTGLNSGPFDDAAREGGAGDEKAKTESKEQGRVEAALDAVEAEEEDETGLPGPDDVPEDKYTPQYGVMLVVGSEGEQAALYEWLNGKMEDGQLKTPGAVVPAKLRVVAV